MTGSLLKKMAKIPESISVTLSCLGLCHTMTCMGRLFALFLPIRRCFYFATPTFIVHVPYHFIDP